MKHSSLMVAVRSAVFVTAALVPGALVAVTAPAAQAQSPAQSQSQSQSQASAATTPHAKLAANNAKASKTAPPFSRLGFGVNVSPLGIGFQVATNVNSHLNLRADGGFFNYTINNISTSGFNVGAKLNLASAGFTADVYPFHKGFRLSPGVLFYNGNQANVTFVAQPGTSFTLNNYTFYSASGANAVTGLGTFGLGNGTPAFTLTTGWGNMVPARGHWSFPFEIGVAFIKAPTVGLTLSGLVCDAQGQNCVNIATDNTAQAALQAQISSYQNDVNQLKTYPIVRFGVAYSIHLR